jgi:hypothetical protein
MKNSNWYGNLIYAPNINELEKKWNECQLHEKELGNLKFHRAFYESVKDKFIKDSINNRNNIVLFTPVKTIPKVNTNYKSNYKLNYKSNKYTKTN